MVAAQRTSEPGGYARGEIGSGDQVVGDWCIENASPSCIIEVVLQFQELRACHAEVPAKLARAEPAEAFSDEPGRGRRRVPQMIAQSAIRIRRPCFTNRNHSIANVGSQPPRKEFLEGPGTHALPVTHAACQLGNGMSNSARWNCGTAAPNFSTAAPWHCGTSALQRAHFGTTALRHRTSAPRHCGTSALTGTPPHQP